MNGDDVTVSPSAFTLQCRIARRCVSYNSLVDIVYHALSEKWLKLTQWSYFYVPPAFKALIKESCNDV